MRVLGLDIGNKRVGVAISDELGIIAQPLETILWEGAELLAEKLRVMITDYEVETLVIGLPVHMSGKEGVEARNIRELADYLSSELDVTVDLWDERLTSVEAERILINGNIKRNNRKKNIDKIAAAIILKGYLSCHENK